MCSTMPAAEVMDLLDRLYTQLDRLIEERELFKVETIGARWDPAAPIS